MKTQDFTEIEKSNVHITVEIIDYKPNSIVIRTILITTKMVLWK